MQIDRAALHELMRLAPEHQVTAHTEHAGHGCAVIGQREDQHRVAPIRPSQLRELARCQASKRRVERIKLNEPGWWHWSSSTSRTVEQDGASQFDADGSAGAHALGDAGRVQAEQFQYAHLHRVGIYGLKQGLHLCHYRCTDKAGQFCDRWQERVEQLRSIHLAQGSPPSGETASETATGFISPKPNAGVGKEIRRMLHFRRPAQLPIG